MALLLFKSNLPIITAPSRPFSGSKIVTPSKISALKIPSNIAGALNKTPLQFFQ